MKYLIEILLLSVCFTIISANLKYHECPNKRQLATVKKFTIDGCKEYPCILRRNTNATLHLDFEAKQRIGNLKLKIAGVIQGKQVPFPANDQNHCKLTLNGDKCPIQKGQKIKYTNQMYVAPNYPQINVVVVYDLLDQNGRSVACFSWPAKIV